ncbi:hypothetical protein SNE40_016172 [Patella caerulea]|uniref:RNA-directed DNA polymerase n=1 Tax=Patella caerulea TaxID=87958 RepID=A0AAN8J8U3_PATCE
MATGNPWGNNDTVTTPGIGGSESNINGSYTNPKAPEGNMPILSLQQHTTATKEDMQTPATKGGNDCLPLLMKIADSIDKLAGDVKSGNQSILQYMQSLNETLGISQTQNLFNRGSNSSTQQISSTPRAGHRAPPLQPVLNTIRHWEYNHPLPPQENWTLPHEDAQIQRAPSTHMANANHSYRSDVPRQKLPTFDGTGDWDSFMLPFNRAAIRNNWDDVEKLDRLIECIRGQAARFQASLPSQIQRDFATLISYMEKRFNRKEPPTTARKRLADLRQKHESNEEFSEEVRRLVTLAYKDVNLVLQDELAAEAFLKGYRNPRVAYEALNRNPRTIAEALDIVTQLEHNYRATLGRDADVARKSRRVSWNDMGMDASLDEASDDGVRQVAHVANPAASPVYGEGHCLEEDMKVIRAMLEKLRGHPDPMGLGLASTQSSRPHSPKPSTPTEGQKTKLSPTTSECFTCREKGHFQRDCPRRISRSPSPSKTGQKLYKIAAQPDKGILVPVTVAETGTDGVVDTGADITVFSMEYADKIALPYREHTTTTLMNAGNGKEMNGFLDVPVRMYIGEIPIDCKICVAPIREDVLIGMDVLKEHNGVILARQGDILIDGTLVPGRHRHQNDCHIARATTQSDIMLSPMTETVIMAELDNPDEGKVGVLDPASLKSGAHTGSVLANMTNKIPIRMVNPTNSTIKIAKGTHLGKMVETVDCESNLDDVSVVNKSSSRAPEHLRDILQEATKNLTDDQAGILESLVTEFHDIFAVNDSDVGCFSGITHHIDTGNAKPIRQPPRRTPLGFQTEEKGHLRQLLDNGTVVPSTSEWASPVVLVRKKDGGVRWCIDYRKINDVTTKDSYPLPNISDCLDTLAGASIFTTLDLQTGYHQIEVAPEDQNKTAFTTRYGLFEYTRMPFGLCGAPGTFQRAMELVLRGLQWDHVLIYLDDVIIASDNFEDHVEHLREVFKRFRNFNLKLKSRKCKLCQDKVLFLGHYVSADGIEANKDLIAVVSDWPIPQNVKQLQAFLGLTNYYRRFIPEYADKAEPLYQLLKKDVSFEWSISQHNAFELLKQSLTRPPVLSFPLPQETFILDTDASNVAVGAVLSQTQNGEERVISYGSKRLGPAQERYCVTRRELLAIVTFTDKYKHYLLGRRFILRTDHGSLTWLYRFKSPQGQLARWLEQLSQFDMIIQHRSGKLHGNADSLSRYPFDEECDCYNAGTYLSRLPCGGCRYCTRVHDQWAKFESDIDDVLPIAVRHVRDRGYVIEEQPSGESWLEGYDSAEISQFQQDDPVLKILHTWLTDAPPIDKQHLFSENPALRHFWLCFPQLVLTNNVIFYTWKDESGNRSLLLVPNKLKRIVLELCHNSVVAGHPGFHRTLSRVKQHFYWYSMRKDVENHVVACPQCSVHKKSSHSHVSGLQEYRAGSPLDRVQLDILGPFPESRKGNRYILVLVDQFTKWTEAYPLPDQTAESVARKFVNEFISRFGVPLEVHTDQGRNFDSDMMKRLGQLLGWAKTRTTPYHPSSNGLVERFNRTLLQMIRCYIDRQDEWDEYIPLLTSAYRSTPHTSTSLTPNQMMLGREVRLPQELIFGLIDHKNNSTNDYVENLRSSIEETHEIARKNLKRSAVGQKRLHDLRINQKTYQVGDIVYILDTARRVGKSPKLQAQWKGPAVITRVLGPVLFEVAQHKKRTVYHHDRLKRCTLESTPIWVNKLRRQLRVDMTVQSDNVGIVDQGTTSREDDSTTSTSPVICEPVINDSTFQGSVESADWPGILDPGRSVESTDSQHQLFPDLKLPDTRFSRSGRPIKKPAKYSDV